ncbi:hypothetical protein QTO34_002703 [Cnephaeus nilssonii]|uniref:Immunoglobulin I-set domain-containing protein n=1 Tax=Cnephaeus nilssonii TaxID=3371016 RepID=A0AA40HSR6_CNENI|nr:hypothetical protein QTO34_002703 [Eptesicus nilssonii]
MTGEGGDPLQGQGLALEPGPDGARKTRGDGTREGNWEAKSGAGSVARPRPGSPVYFEIGSTNTTLTIRRATPQDSGKYEVFVENSLGMDQSFARVDVA